VDEGASAPARKAAEKIMARIRMYGFMVRSNINLKFNISRIPFGCLQMALEADVVVLVYAVIPLQ
jgi:hypothetical protein